MGVLDREWSRKEDPPSSSGLRQSSSGRVPQWALEVAFNEQLRSYSTETSGRRRNRLRVPRRRRARSSAFTLRVRTAALSAFVAALYLTPTV